MATDLVPQSTQTDGRWKIGWVPGTSANPLSVAILKAATSFNLTYSFTPDGFPFATTQATINDPRLTLPQDLSKLGKLSDALSLKYVDSKTPGSAAVVLTDFSQGYFVLRRGIDNSVDWTVGDIVYVLTVQVGVATPDAPTENGVDTMSQPVGFTGLTQRRVPLVA